jgi:phosphoadenosine phosphosulfate reductase
MSTPGRPKGEHRTAQHEGSPVRATALHARPSSRYDAKLAHARALLQATATAHGEGVVQATSLGAEDMVITDLISAAKLPISIGTLDTGLLHAETLALLTRIEARYGLRVEAMQPRREAVIQFVARHGERSMFQSIAQRKACCDLRKLEPLRRLLAGKRAWITGLRREQSGQRADVPFSELHADGRVKVNPLADWTWGDVWHYIATNDVPYNPLHDQFFPSIGCAPCTRAISLGEDMRAGRWWWEDEAAKECGLHVKNLEGTPA